MNKYILIFFVYTQIISGEEMNIVNNEKTKKEIKNESVKSGETYEHYSGKQYKIVALAHYSENPDEIFVVYQGLYEDPVFGKNPIWARPLKMFCENVMLNGKEQKRFKKIA